MGFFIQIRRSGPFRNRRFAVHRSEIRAGRGIENDLVILHPEVPRNAGHFIAEGKKLYWNGADGRTLNALESSIQLGPYRLRGRASSRLRYVLLLLLIGSLAGTILLSGLKGKRKKARKEVDSSIVLLPAPDTYGNPKGKGGQAQEFGFEAKGKKNMELHFTAGNIHRSDQLEIFLNGRSIAFAAPCPDRWGTEERMVLSRDALKGGKNRLEFRNRFTPDGGRIWGVRNIYTLKMTEDEAARIQSADDWAERARVTFEQRSTAVGQTWRSRQYLQKAKAGWKSQARPVPEKAVLLERSIEKEMERLMSRRRSEAKAALSLGDRERAASIYHALVSEFPDQADPTRVQIEEEMAEVLR
jgi:hypothetical protein